MADISTIARVCTLTCDVLELRMFVNVTLEYNHRKSEEYKQIFSVFSRYNAHFFNALIEHEIETRPVALSAGSVDVDNYPVGT